MKVYIVQTERPYEVPYFFGVYSDKELAFKVRDKVTHYGVNVFEVDVNEEPELDSTARSPFYKEVPMEYITPAKP